jgi:hypothetical protein
MIKNVDAHKPDLLVFTGDQIYEGGNPTRKEFDRLPLTDYLYKWYIWCIAYSPVTRKIPSIVLADDHDYWQGNIYGESGTMSYIKNHDSGGVCTDPAFVRSMEATQVSHNPDPYDPAPTGAGIPVYYGGFKYGGISFAVIEDRKFKTSRRKMRAQLEAQGKVIKTIRDMKFVDSPEATLLGDRQIVFLEKWVHDWEGAVMKVVLMQGIFAAATTRTDRTVAHDIDAGGWPPRGRNRALAALRKGYSFILAGDQHLAVVLQHGVDDHGDACYQFGVPAVGAKFRRWWDPPAPGKGHEKGKPAYTGGYEDFFKNKFTVYAVGNLKKSRQEVLDENMKLGRKSASYCSNRSIACDGYGIVRLSKSAKTITMEAWPWNGGPQTPDRMFKDWPVTISVYDNYQRKPSGYLPDLEIKGGDNALVQVVHEKSKEIIYSVRAHKGKFTPRVFEEGTYTVIVSEPGTKKIEKFKKVKPVDKPGASKIKVKF